MRILWLIIIGIIAGWFACMLTRGRGLGIVGDLLVGMIGALIGGRVLGWFGIFTHGLKGSLVTAVAGAITLLSLIRLVKVA